MNPNQIRELAAAFQKSRILLSAFELDLFSTIGREGKSASFLAQQLQLDPHGCERLLNALVSLGFLTIQEGLYENQEAGLQYLCRESPDYMGGLMHTNHLWTSWSQLTQVVRTGKSAHPTEINDRGEQWLLSFITAMHDRAVKQAPPQVAAIDMTGVRTLLDVGGGSGAFSMEFIRQHPTVRAMVFDLPNVVPITGMFLKREGFADRVTTHTGDYTVDELPGGHDLIFLSAIIHSNSLEVNAGLIHKCFKALNPGGRIVIQDWVMNADRTLPLAGAVFAINMLVGTEAGDCFTEQEVATLLTDAGFSEISRKEFESGLSQVVAHKA
ncbi:MAG: acetylserotonin O-methyltransferase [Marinilabiliales bacterium]|nr:acetylserotonin O-methyltransferase [Marinilabiliales bacterium]